MSISITFSLALLTEITNLVISVNTSEQERPKYMSYTGLSWGAGFVLGPVIGGAFAESGATWRWAFYINLVT